MECIKKLNLFPSLTIDLSRHLETQSIYDEYFSLVIKGIPDNPWRAQCKHCNLRYCYENIDRSSSMHA